MVIKNPAFFPAVSLMLFVFSSVQAQNPPARAIENVTIHMAGDSVISSGTIVWRNGLIESMGVNIDIPFDAYSIDGGDSLHVYPGLVDGFALWGSPELPQDFDDPDVPGQPEYQRAGIQPNRSFSDFINTEDENLIDALEQGFTTAALSLKGFMLPGQLEIYFLNGEETVNHLFKSNHAYPFQFEDAPAGVYPGTTMGVMANFRQLMYDAEALYQHMEYYTLDETGIPAPRRNQVLESLFPVLNAEKKIYFEGDSPEDIERMLVLRDEFGFDVVIVSGREAYKIADELAERNIPVLASIDLPEIPDWHESESDSTNESVSEEQQLHRDRQMQSYLNRVRNIRQLLDAGVEVGFASNGLDLEDIEVHTRTLLDEGNLSADELLTIMTTSTASILGIEDKVGNLQPGWIASFSILTNVTGMDEVKVLKTVSNGVIHEF